MREKEGAQLEKDLLERLGEMEKELAIIETRAPHRLIEERDRLKAAIQELSEKEEVDEEDLMLIALEGGADDMTTEEDSYEIVTEPEAFEKVLTAVKEAGLTPPVAEVTMIPQSTVKLHFQSSILSISRRF